MTKFNIISSFCAGGSIELNSGSKRGLGIVVKKKWFSDYNIEETCHVCDNSARWDKSEYSPIMDIDGECVKLIGFRHRLDEDPYKLSVCKSCFKAKSVGLNPNSAEIVSLKYGITNSDALLHIHTRNESPFYRKNHGSDAEYREFQNSYRGMDEDTKSDLITKQNQSRKNRFQETIDDIGIEAFKKSRDSSSMEYFVGKYGEDIGIKMFNEKTSKTSRRRPQNASKEEMVKWLSYAYGVKSLYDFIKVVNDKIVSMDEFDRSFFIKKSTRYGGVYNKENTLMLFGMEVYDIKNIYELFNVKEQMVVKINKINDNVFSYIVKEDGYHFRSIGEYKIYDAIKEHVNILGVNRSYPNQNRGKVGKKYYDISFEYQSVTYFLEIVGFDDEKYLDNVNEKCKTWGSVKIKVSRLNDFVNDIKNGNKLKNEYV